jgi:hypothetical protein
MQSVPENPNTKNPMTVADTHIVQALDPMKPVARVPLSFAGEKQSERRKWITSESSFPDFVSSLDSLKHLLR